MNVYVLIMDGGDYEPQFPCGVYSTLNKAKIAAIEAIKEDADDNFYIKVVEMDVYHSLDFDNCKTIEL